MYKYNILIHTITLCFLPAGHPIFKPSIAMIIAGLTIAQRHYTFTISSYGRLVRVPLYHQRPSLCWDVEQLPNCKPSRFSKTDFFQFVQAAEALIQPLVATLGQYSRKAAGGQQEGSRRPAAPSTHPTLSPAPLAAPSSCSNTCDSINQYSLSSLIKTQGNCLAKFMPGTNGRCFPAINSGYVC